MLVPDITVYDALKSIMSEDKARNVVEAIKKQVTDEVDTKANILATKEDLAKLKEDMLKQETRLSQTIYIVGIVQFLAIIGSILFILKFTHS